MAPADEAKKRERVLRDVRWAAERLGTSLQGARDWIRRNRIPHTKIARRLVFLETNFWLVFETPPDQEPQFDAAAIADDVIAGAGRRRR